MEKYGVDESPFTTEAKVAADKREDVRCPVCNEPVEQHGIVLRCKTHGTKPFESTVR